MKENLTWNTIFHRIAVNDDREAFKTLFFDFYPSLCVFAQQYIPSHDTCEDIVQDTFFQLWKNRKKIEVNSSFRNYLTTCVRNNCLDHLRKQTVRHNYASGQSEPAYTDTPEDVLTIRELGEKLQIILQVLPEHIRTAFEMSRFENLTYNEIAEKMSLSPKTIESYISKTLRILRAELKEYLPLLIL